MSKNDQSALFPVTSGNDSKSSHSLHELTAAVIKKSFDPRLIGEHLIALAEMPNGIELAVAYAAIIAKARKARLDVASRTGAER